MVKRTAYIQTAVYSLAHFVTDFSCAFLIFASVAHTDGLPLKLLIYNFCAFALQLPLGLIADRLNKNSLAASLGCVFIALSFAFSQLAFAPVIISGVGNALFHVGGGLDVMNSHPGRFSGLGIFVAPGAAGIFLGTLLGKRYPQTLFAAPLLLCIFAVLMLTAVYIPNRSFRSANEPVNFSNAGNVRSVFALICLFAVVVLRSYAGMLFGFVWKKGVLAAVFMLGVVFGKAAGGIIADRLGQALTCAVSLGAAGILFLFSGNAACGIAAVFLFNMTMPVTLGIASHILKGAKGFSFGLLTFALFTGCLPEFMGFELFSGSGAVYCALSFMSLILIMLGIRLSGGKKNA